MPTVRSHVRQAWTQRGQVCQGDGQSRLPVVPCSSTCCWWQSRCRESQVWPELERDYTKHASVRGAFRPTACTQTSFQGQAGHQITGSQLSIVCPVGQGKGRQAWCQAGASSLAGQENPNRHTSSASAPCRSWAGHGYLATEKPGEHHARGHCATDQGVQANAV